MLDVKISNYKGTLNKSFLASSICFEIVDLAPASGSAILVRESFAVVVVVVGVATAASSLQY